MLFNSRFKPWQGFIYIYTYTYIHIYLYTYVHVYMICWGAYSDVRLEALVQQSGLCRSFEKVSSSLLQPLDNLSWVGFCFPPTEMSGQRAHLGCLFHVVESLISRDLEP